MKIFVIGDIHGNLRALKQVLERSNFDYENDMLIQLGDVVDRWPESAQCVEELLKITHRVDIRGNHDQWCSEWLEYGIAKPIWLQQGGESTRQSYIDSGLLIEQSHKNFFKYQYNYYIDDQNRVFVHAGWFHTDGLGKESSNSEYYWTRQFWQTALSGKNSQDIPKILRPYKEIFIGHTTTMCWKTDQPMNACNVWNLDTGCGGKGRLTIMDINTHQYWQSDLVDDMYNDLSEDIKNRYLI